MSAERFDVIVVGGGPAGLEAALVLGRMRRRVLLLDTDAPANAVSEAMHGFLSRDGTPPEEVRRIAADQLDPYDSVERRAVAATGAAHAGGAFEVELEDGAPVAAGHLLLAHGMRYGLPDLDGVTELWGKRVFHCPYCHGWEVRDQPIAVLGCGEKSVHQALLLSSLSDDVVLLCDGEEPDAGGRERLAAGGVEPVGERVERIEPSAGGLRVVLAGRDPLERHALFVRPELALACDLAVALGAELTDAGAVATDPSGLSSVPGLYAAGDAGAPVQSVSVAVGTGARAAYAINAELATNVQEQGVSGGLRDVRRG